MSKSNFVDATAVTLSGLCVMHCLALPVLAAFLPVLGQVSEAEWIHKVFVLIAIPLSLGAAFQSKPGKGRSIFFGLAILGLSIMLAAAFVHELHEIEAVLTVIGASCLALAHIWRWKHHAGH